MKWFSRASVFLLLVVAVQFVALAAPVSAAEGFNIVTSPLPIKLSTAPGRTVAAELRVKSLNTTPETIKVGLMKFGATGDSGQPNIFDLTAKDTFAQWVHFEPEQFVAEPNVWKTVKMTINVPQDASLGYYMAVTFSRASDTGKEKGTNFKGAAATLVLLEINNGNEKRSLQFVDFSVDHKVYEYLPVNFKVKVHNNGNIYLAPKGNIYIQKGDKPVSSIIFNEAEGSVLPASNRVYNVPWKSGFPLYTDRVVNNKPVDDGHGHTAQDLKWDFTQFNRFRIGHYTAKLLVVYDDGTHDVPLESTVSFWVIPWKLLLLALVVLLLIGYGVWMLSRSFIRRAQHGARKLKRRG